MEKQSQNYLPTTEPFDPKQKKPNHMPNSHGRDGIVVNSDPDMKKGLLKLLGKLTKHVSFKATNPPSSSKAALSWK